MATSRREPRSPTDGAPASSAPVSSSSFFTDLLPDLEQAGAVLPDKARRLQGLDELTVEEAITTRELMKLAISVSCGAAFQLCC